MARLDNLASAVHVETVNRGERDIRSLLCRDPRGLIGPQIRVQQSLGCDQGKIHGVTRNPSSSGQPSMACLMQTV